MAPHSAAGTWQWCRVMGAGGPSILGRLEAAERGVGDACGASKHTPPAQGVEASCPRVGASHTRWTGGCTSTPPPCIHPSPPPQTLPSTRTGILTGIKIGKILVHRHGAGEEVVYAKLPADIARRRVLLMDPVVGTGHTATRAIQTLLDRGVAEDRLLLLCVILTPEAAHRVCGQFPAIKIIASEIDDGLDSEFRVVPGVGEWGNRYFSG